MSATVGIKGWMERVLEKPFVEAEMFRVETTKAKPGEESMVPVYLLGGFSVVYLVFCIYSTARFLF